MSCEAIICDWNGTINGDRDERPILERIAVDLFKGSIPFHPFRMARLLKTKKELDALYREKRHEVEFDYVIEMFSIYNQKIIKGVPVSFVRRSVENYANRQQTLEKLDYRVLRPVAERHRAGVTTGILSAGYGYGIQAILKAAGYDDCFDFYETNQLTESNGRAIAFELNIYKNKPQFLLNLLKGRNLDAKKVVYIGDSEDDTDCFKIVGYPVVAFLAPEELKQKYTEKYRAIVPADEAELAQYLQCV